MMNSNIFSLILLFISHSLLPLLSQAQSAFPNQEKLDAVGHTIFEKGSILGFSVAIDSAGKTIYSQSFGHMNTQKTKPVTVETKFDIASVSKLLGVNVIMKLVDNGQLSLEQTLDVLLPSFPEQELAKKITLEHLLSHTSGLQDYIIEFGTEFITKGLKPGKAEYLAFFLDKGLEFDPGSHYQYNNSGFLLMAYIAEDVTGKSYQELINEIINEPTGLDFQLIKYVSDSPDFSFLFDYGDDKIQFPIDGFKKGRFDQIPLWDYVIGDGGLTSSSKKLAKLPYYWANEKIISHESYTNMTSPKALNDRLKTGYGLGVRNGKFLGEDIIGHTGGWRSTYAIMVYFPERNLTFAGLMNTDGTQTQMPYIFAKYMASYLGKTIPDYKSQSIKFENPQRLAGEYRGYSVVLDTEGEIITIKMKKKMLNYCINGHCEPIFYIGENKFWLESYPYDFIEFQINEKGQSMAINEYYYGFFQVFRKKIDPTTEP